MLRVLLLLGFVCGCFGHGRLWEPPSRSSMWRRGFENPENYNDHELFCGGFGNQWEVYDGLCGACGDRYQGPWDNEAGGLYANGIIGAEYEPGSEIEITLDITANHMGWHEFRLCAWNDVDTRVDPECLDENLLALRDGTTRVVQPPGTGFTSWTFVLPPAVVCDQCILQWKWNTGNRWGVDPDGTECVGCGPQEQFYGCSDIAIQLPINGTLPPTTTDATTTPGATTTSTAGTTTTPGPTTTTTEGPTTTSGPIDEFCDNTTEGLHEHPTDCTLFINCVGNIEYINECPECTYYNHDILACDFPLDDAVCYDDVCSVLPDN